MPALAQQAEPEEPVEEEGVEEAPADEAPVEGEAGQTPEDPVEALEQRLAQQQEEIATLRRQLEESQRQSEQLETVVDELEGVNASVEDLQAFEQQREFVAQQRVETLAMAVRVLRDASYSLYMGDADVLDGLDYAGEVLDGEARDAALLAAELVRRGDLFNARSWVERAGRQAQIALEAAGGRMANVEQ